MFLDGIPSATVKKGASGDNEVSYFEGIPIGMKYDADSIIIANHLDITVKTHKVSGAGAQVSINSNHKAL